MRKGLFIGINDYLHLPNLSGCNSDAIEMSSVLARHASGSPNFNNRVITTAESQITASEMETAIKELYSGSCDVTLLYFAGHGLFDSDLEEGMLLPQDYQSREGIRISDILKWASDARDIRNKIIILDCCQAGSAGEARQLKGGESVIGDGITILTACKKEEVAKENCKNGVFTGLMLQALHGGAANILGHITPGNLYSFVDNALGPWEQRPVFKTNVSQFIALREMTPLVPLDTLRKLPEWFPEEEYVFPLNPSFEPEAKNQFNAENGEVFSQLQKCNRHSLIEPVEAEHMYFAAMNSTGCRLTALGTYYRSLAEKGHF
ncbi:caspase family protein [Alteromonadaceae bacterium M269]|nr:caspase family protein [Alteromonadaceae bacterium M269]